MLTVTVKVTKEFRIRLFLALLFCRLAARIAHVDYVIEDVDESGS